MARNFSENGTYHVYNRGVRKQKLFHKDSDYVRFLFCMFLFLGTYSVKNLQRYLRFEELDVQHRKLHIAKFLTENQSQILEHQKVELVAFCLMPNHFHLILKELEPNGISNYLQRLLNSYSKFFNLKYKHSGHVFQNKYKHRTIYSDEQYALTSAYIHNNPADIPRWKDREQEYPWSSYKNFTQENIWKKFLSCDDLLNTFDTKKDYHDFVQHRKLHNALKKSEFLRF